MTEVFLRVYKDHFSEPEDYEFTFDGGELMVGDEITFQGTAMVVKRRRWNEHGVLEFVVGPLRRAVVPVGRRRPQI